MMDITEIMNEMANGRNCAQIVLGAFADEAGYDMEETERMAACLGGDCGMGQICGCVSGALIAAGLLGVEKERSKDFTAEFEHRFGSCICRELLEEKDREVCPHLIAGAIEILREMLSE